MSLRAKLNGLPLAFRNGTTSDLNTILGLAGSAPIDNGVRIDEVFLFHGFDLTNPLAGFDPGLVWSAETLTVDGNYTQAPAATLEIDLGGTAEGQFDVLDIGGTAMLNGNLQISFANGFAPSPGDLFPILKAAETIGTWTLSGASEGFWLLPTPTGRSLYFGDLPAGDYDHNGVVDSMDYDRWQAEFGAGGTASADGNGDGLVDGADYIVWRRNLGVTVFADGAAGARQTVAARVPEPSLALVVSWGVLLSGATRAFRHDRVQQS